MAVFATRVRISTSSIPEGKDGESYSFTFEATSADAEEGDILTWNCDSPLPAGMTFEDGSLTGTPSEAGSFNILIEATVGSKTSRQWYTLVIKPVPPVITTESLPSAKVGEIYSAALSATGTKPITWSADVLPEGLTIYESSGVISGVPYAF